MSIKNFIPTLWSARLQANLDKKLVYADVVNHDYEGEIKKLGDKVKINQIGPITIKDYLTGDGAPKKLADPEEVTSTQQELVIDKAKYFNFKVDDIDAAQANVKLVDKAMDRASYAIGDVIDQHIASFVKDAGIKVGSTATPIDVEVANAYDQLVDLAVKLDENNVTRAGRFAIIPAWYLGMLSKDPRFTKDFKVLANGVIDGADVAGFTLRMSNNVPVAANKYSIMAGIEQAITYAGQITEIESYRPEKTFADAVKGLFVYGTKVIEPKALVNFTCKVKGA